MRSKAICLLGEKSAGKTTMLQGLRSGAVSDNPLPTLVYDNQIDSTNHRVYTELSGDPKSLSLIAQHLKNDLFLVCVDLSKPFDVSAVDVYLEQLLTIDVQIVFIGCKQDIAHIGAIDELRAYLKKLDLNPDSCLVLTSKNTIEQWRAPLEEKLNYILNPSIGANISQFFGTQTSSATSPPSNQTISL